MEPSAEIAIPAELAMPARRRFVAFHKWDRNFFLAFAAGKAWSQGHHFFCILHGAVGIYAPYRAGGFGIELRWSRSLRRRALLRGRGIG